MSKHTHAELMVQYAQDAAETETPWERWELLFPGYDWETCKGSPLWNPATKYRRKPKTILINGFEVPEPCRDPLLYNTAYYMPDPVDSFKWAGSVWYDDEIDHERLKAGVVHLTREAAVCHTEAILSFTQVKE